MVEFISVCRYTGGHATIKGVNYTTTITKTIIS